MLWKYVYISIAPYQIRIDNVGNCIGRMRASHVRLILISLTWNCTTFNNFFSKLTTNPLCVSQKTAHGDADFATRRRRTGPLSILILKTLAGLSLAGEVVNHIWIYGSKAAEGCSAFQRQSYFSSCQQRAPGHRLSLCNITVAMVLQDNWIKMTLNQNLPISGVYVGFFTLTL